MINPSSWRRIRCRSGNCSSSRRRLSSARISVAMSRPCARFQFCGVEGNRPLDCRPHEVHYTLSSVYRTNYVVACCAARGGGRVSRKHHFPASRTTQCSSPLLFSSNRGCSSKVKKSVENAGVVSDLLHVGTRFDRVRTSLRVCGGARRDRGKRAVEPEPILPGPRMVIFMHPPRPGRRCPRPAGSVPGGSRRSAPPQASRPAVPPTPQRPRPPGR